MVKKENRPYWVIGAVFWSLFIAGVIVGGLHWWNWTALPIFALIFGISVWIIYS